VVLFVGIFFVFYAANPSSNSSRAVADKKISDTTVEDDTQSSDSVRNFAG
jgi:hypothetical protein